MADIGYKSAPREWLENIAEKIKKKWRAFCAMLRHGNWRVACSMLIMGTGQMMYRQWAKGALYLLVQAGFIVYLVLTGARDFFGLFTLGSVEANPWYGIEGDNSVIMLITGILSVIVMVIYVSLYIANVRGVYVTQLRV